MDLSTIKPIAAAIALLPIIGVSIGLGNLFSTYLSSIARNPDVKGELFTRAMMGAALMELGTLIAFVLAMLILFV